MASWGGGGRRGRAWSFRAKYNIKPYENQNCTHMQGGKESDKLLESS